MCCIFQNLHKFYLRVTTTCQPKSLTGFSISAIMYSAGLDASNQCNLSITGKWGDGVINGGSFCEEVTNFHSLDIVSSPKQIFFEGFRYLFNSWVNQLQHTSLLHIYCSNHSAITSSCVTLVLFPTCSVHMN